MPKDKRKRKLPSAGSDSILSEFRRMVKELRKMGTRLIASHKKRLSEKPTNAISILNDGSGNHQIKVVLYGKNYYQELVIIAERVLTTSVVEFLRIQNMKLTPNIVVA